MSRRERLLIVILLALLAGVPGALAQTVTDTDLQVTPIVAGQLAQPTSMEFVAPDDFLVLEKASLVPALPFAGLVALASLLGGAATIVLRRGSAPHGRSSLVRRQLLASALLVVSLACSRTSEPSAPPQEPGASGHGYALLHAILGQEKQVSQLLIIKHDRPELGVVIAAIADTCGTAYARLEELAELHPRLDLADTGLPATETQARLLIGATRREQLLASSGQELELQLLLTQNEALTYAAHLADALSRSEPDPERLAFIRALWTDLTSLLHDVQGLLRHPVRSAG